jgi:hypothetical protein
LLFQRELCLLLSAFRELTLLFQRELTLLLQRELCLLFQRELLRELMQVQLMGNLPDYMTLLTLCLLWVLRPLHHRCLLRAFDQGIDSASLLNAIKSHWIFPLKR